MLLVGAGNPLDSELNILLSSPRLMRDAMHRLKRSPGASETNTAFTHRAGGAY